MTKVWVLLLSVLLIRLPQEKNPRTSGCVPALIPKSLILGPCWLSLIVVLRVPVDTTALLLAHPWFLVPLGIDQNSFGCYGHYFKSANCAASLITLLITKGCGFPTAKPLRTWRIARLLRPGDEWLTCIRRHKRWICALTIKAASGRLGVQVIVVQKQGDAWVSPLALVKAEEVR